MQTRTFLFADLRDYTRFVEHHGDAAAKTLIADYRTLVRAEVARHEGGEIKTEGDSFYVVFGSARQALACGIAIVREADAYSRVRPDRPMRVGVGIHAGEPEPHEGQFVGAAVIVAARLAQAAGAGELLVSDVVRALIPKGTAPPMEVREVALKGIAEAPRVFSVAWQSAERAAAPPAATVAPAVVSVAAAEPQGHQVLCPEMVGRDGELATLDALFGEVSAGRGRAALIAGEAGLGKSTLVRRFLEGARTRGALTLVGECSEVEARRPFGPVIDAFVAAGITLPGALQQGGPGAQAVVESETYRVHAGFASALEDVSRERTCVLTLEDVHWADPATLELVPYLARKLRGARVLIVATYRSDELHRRHPLNHLLAELARGRLATEVRLHALSEDETAAVIKAALGLRRAPTTAFRQAIQDRCGGNPFFVEEVLAALVERGDLTYKDGSWQRSKEVHQIAIPVSVRDAVEQRLHSLTQRALRTVHVASVIGQRFDFELLRTVAEMTEEELLEALREAVDAQLVIEDRGADEAYRFRHALTREAVLDELMARERRILHRRIGEAIERAAGAEARQRAEELAYHFDEARDAERARRYHDLAADQASRAFAHASALAHRERAVELMPDDDTALPAAQLRLAHAALNAGEFGRGARAAEEARRGFEAMGDRRRAAEAKLAVAFARGSMGEMNAERELTAEAIGELEPLGPSVELARAYALRSRRAMLDRRPDTVALGREAIAMAEQVGDIQSRIRAMISAGSATSGIDPVEGLAMLREALALAQQHDLVILASIAHNNIGVALPRVGAPRAEIDRAREEFVAHARRYGLRGTTIALAKFFPPLFEGDWDRALQAAEEERDDSVFSYSIEIAEAIIQTARQGPEVGLPLLAEPRAKLLATGEPQSIVNASRTSVAYLLAGDPRTAIEHAQPALDLTIEQIGPGAGSIPGLLAALRADDADAAARWAARLAETPATAGPRDPLEAARTLGAAATAWFAGDAEAALAGLARAAETLQRERFFFFASLIRLERARLLAAKGRRGEARAEVEATMPFWRKAKAAWMIAQTERWLADEGLVATPA